MHHNWSDGKEEASIDYEWCIKMMVSANINKSRKKIYSDKKMGWYYKIKSTSMYLKLKERENVHLRRIANINKAK